MSEEPSVYEASNQQPLKKQPTFWQQVYRHRLALISLAVALVSLGYNTWRNEATEAHRNTRAAAFTILQELGELQQITSYRHYFYSRIREQDIPAQEGSDWVRGWGKVLLIGDLSSLMPDTVHQSAMDLYTNWQQHAGSLEMGPNNDAAQTAEEAIMNSIAHTRDAVLATLKSLE